MFNTVDTTKNFKSVIFAGKDSFDDFGVTISSYTVGDAEINEVRASVPYQNGDYDYTKLNGKVSYKNRAVTVVFNVIAPDFDTADRIRSKLVIWLQSARGVDMRISELKDRHFKNVSCRFEEGAFVKKYRHTWELTAIFTCYPYIVLDYTRPTTYTVSTLTELTYELTADESIIPSFTFLEGSGTILYGGKYYTVPSGAERYQITDITFRPGKNTFSAAGGSASGSAKLLVECIREVL